VCSSDLIDRQEIGVNGKSAIQELEDNLNIPVVSIAKLDDLIELMKISGDLKVHLPSIIQYQQQYGITV
jgi:orotate phosphoribosyltransferase